MNAGSALDGFVPLHALAPPTRECFMPSQDSPSWHFLGRVRCDADSASCCVSACLPSRWRAWGRWRCRRTRSSRRARWCRRMRSSPSRPHWTGSAALSATSTLRSCKTRSRRAKLDASHMWRRHGKCETLCSAHNRLATHSTPVTFEQPLLYRPRRGCACLTCTEEGCVTARFVPRRRGAGWRSRPRS